MRTLFMFSEIVPIKSNNVQLIDCKFYVVFLFYEDLIWSPPCKSTPGGYIRPLLRSFNNSNFFERVPQIVHIKDENSHDNPLCPTVSGTHWHLRLALFLVSFMFPAHNVRRRSLPRQERKSEVNYVRLLTPYVCITIHFKI